MCFYENFSEINIFMLLPRFYFMYLYKKKEKPGLSCTKLKLELLAT